MTKRMTHDCRLLAQPGTMSSSRSRLIPVLGLNAAPMAGSQGKAVSGRALEARAKTDRLDVIKLVINLWAGLRGERDSMRVIRVLPLQHQASRHLIRDRGQLQREVLQHRDRIRKLLVATRWPESVHSRKFASRLAARCKRNSTNGSHAGASG
ncbi:hypothetical protein RI103_15865 [Paraburkholderia sp. FT54]|uniref:hypothetical protein n=1 Tax=Paraburkholderia sp. FT54 TaxID=3074437 RepID=UPI002877BF23|nr:hypothetical protein [Paraburkholderia sp. FT54]WNC89146.1 hypothetical protein RI103_15865 [Paraburkholderia sp. FT54]